MRPESFVQIEPTPWPSGYGEAIAMLALSPDDFAERYGLRFFEGSDNLDFYRAVALRLPSRRRVGLVRHRGNPTSATELHADVEDDSLGAIREFLKSSELTADDLVWVRGDISIDQLRAAEQAGD